MNLKKCQYGKMTRMGEAMTDSVGTLDALEYYNKPIIDLLKGVHKKYIGRSTLSSLDCEFL